MSESLGLVEVVGYSTAVYVADQMVKTADVEIQKVERARGDGWMTVYVTGDVGAVNASVAAGEDTAKRVDNFVSSKVIARPANDLSEFSQTKPSAPEAPETETKPATKAEPKTESKSETKPADNSNKTEKSTPKQSNSTNKSTTRRSNNTRNTRNNNTDNKKK